MAQANTSTWCTDHENTAMWAQPSRYPCHSGRRGSRSTANTAASANTVPGPLAGNHVLTIVEGKEKLHALGASTLQVGALPIRFELV